MSTADRDELDRMLSQGRFTFLGMAEALLAAPAALAGWSEETVRRAADCAAADMRVIIELDADVKGRPIVSLVALGFDQRVVIGSVRGRDGPTAH